MSILKNFLDFAGLSAYDNKIKQIINSKVAKIKMNNNTLTPDSGGEINLGNIATTSVASDSANGLMSKEDYTRLKNVAAGAEVNIQSDWNELNTSSDAFINNKPALGTASAKNYTTEVTSESSDLVTSDGIYNAIDEVENVAETLVKDTVGWTGKNRFDVGNDISEWLSTGIDGTYVTSDPISSKVTANLDRSTGSIVVTNYDSSGWWWMSKEIKLTKNIDYKLVNFGSIAKKVLGLSSIQAGTIGTEITVSDGVFNSGNYDYWIISIFPNAVDVSNMMVLLANESDVTFEPYHATVDTVKADKVTNATAGHLAGLDSNGNLTDSGVSPTEEVTVEGNPVTFVSPFEQDAKSVVVSVKPIQDLHGLPFPYVGGAYKNKLKTKTTSYSTSGVTVNVNSDGIISLDGTASANVFIQISDNVSLPSDTYILSGCPSDGGGSTYRLYSQDSQGGHVVFDNGSGGTITYDESYTLQVFIAIYNGANVSGKIFKPMIRLATESDATFAPYSNICPISGIDEVEIGVTGKNLWNPDDTVNGFLNTDGSVRSYVGFSTTNYRKCDANETYTLSYYRTGVGDGSGMRIAWYDANKNFIRRDGDIEAQTVGLKQISATAPTNAVYMRASMYTYASYTEKQQLELGSTPTPYEPYVSHTTTLPLPSTLYGGDVDVTEGSADNKSAIVDLSTLTWNYDSSVEFFVADLPLEIRGIIKNNSPLICEAFEDAEIRTVDYIKNHAGSILVNATYNLWCNTGSTTVTPTGKAVYELATPTTLSFTPTDVELLEGTNVVSTNGEKVAVTYKAGILATLGDIDDLNDKVKTKFDKKDVAKVEGTNASKPYSVGDYMLRSDGFYRVTSSIANGAAITNNNTTKVTVGGELANKVNNDDSRLSDARTPSNDNSLLHTSGNEGYISGTKYFMNGNIAMAVDQFSASNTYEVGSYTVYQGQLYKCTVRHFESDWDSSHFTISNNIIVANGTIAAGTYETIGSDYAENFEALENCPVYRFVTLDGEKIRLAQPNDYILGVTSESPSVIGDSMKQGISVGLLGKLWVEHDGSAEINDYVISGENGIAIKSDKGYRVMAVDGNKCKVLVK